MDALQAISPVTLLSIRSIDTYWHPFNLKKILKSSNLFLNLIKFQTFWKSSLSQCFFFVVIHVGCRIIYPVCTIRNVSWHLWSVNSVVFLRSFLRNGKGWKSSFIPVFKPFSHYLYSWKFIWTEKGALEPVGSRWLGPTCLAPGWTSQRVLIGWAYALKNSAARKPPGWPGVERNFLSQSLPAKVYLFGRVRWSRTITEDIFMNSSRWSLGRFLEKCVR